MIKKKKKNKNALECIDCNKETTDYYKIATNKGHIVKCAKCYELWMSRMVRDNTLTQNPHSRSNGLHYQDE